MLFFFLQMIQWLYILPMGFTLKHILCHMFVPNFWHKNELNLKNELEMKPKMLLCSFLQWFLIFIFIFVI